MAQPTRQNRKKANETFSVAMKPPRSRRRKLLMWRDAALLIAPFTLLYLVFFIFPTLRVVQLSFTDAPLIGNGNFVGLANYKRLLGDFLFWKSLKNTGYFVLLTVIPNTLFGLMFALMVVRLKRLRSWVLAAFFLPNMLTVSVVTLIWQWLLDSQFGVFNLLLGTKFAVFSNPDWAMPAVAFITIWWTVGFNMLLFIAGLQAIPKEYYEAASIDGATGNQIFFGITWPLLWPITALVLTLQLIAQLKIFDQVWLLTRGGPFNSTIVMLQFVYREAFQNFRGGYASAISIVLFLVIMVASIVQFWILRSGRR
ncbi:MAG: sugar ABC transporter permease [Trueperaceae bacterium]|nr:sugar ABC transporter permease [Trueperaceae bacterium]